MPSAATPKEFRLFNNSIQARRRARQSIRRTTHPSHQCFIDATYTSVFRRLQEGKERRDLCEVGKALSRGTTRAAGYVVPPLRGMADLKPPNMSSHPRGLRLEDGKFSVPAWSRPEKHGIGRILASKMRLGLVPILETNG